jgi:two-component system LytT family response regulator
MPFANVMNTRLRAYLVDDELPALTRLTRLLEETGRVEVIGSTSNPQTAFEFLCENHPDLVFLDIQMPGMSGFDLLSRLNRQPIVVFTTAYDQYALRAFEVNSIDYLLKPVEAEQLRRALDKLDQLRSNSPGGWVERPEFRKMIEELARTLREPRSEFTQRIPARIGERTQLVDVPRISHFFAEDRLTYAVTEAKTYCVEWSISELEHRLDSVGFIRTHRAVLLNVAWIEDLSPLFAGRMMVRLKDSKRTELTVARDRVRVLKARLGL